MNKTRLKTVSIAASHEQHRLSKGQKAFNALIKQIEGKRARLAAWEAAIPPFQSRYASEVVPLLDALTELQVKMVHCLDRASGHKALSRTDRRAVAELIAQLAGPLVAAHDDVQMKAIYNRHSRSDYDREVAADIEGMKSMLEDVLDVELGDDLDLNSPEELLTRARAEMMEQQAKFEADRQAREERRAKRKKSAKQLAREAQEQADAHQSSQSIREVYRKLASALHPDREPDAQERERKTGLMQRVNQAYAKNNLLHLLELQLELEHIDQASINNIGEDRLKHYNKVLKEQLVELEHEILHVEGGFKEQFGISPFEGVSPHNILRDLERDIAVHRQTLGDMQGDLIAFEDIKTLRSSLRGLRRRPRMKDDLDDLPF